MNRRNFLASLIFGTTVPAATTSLLYAKASRAVAEGRAMTNALKEYAELVENHIRSGKPIPFKIVPNRTGTALLPCRLVKWKA